ncbi:MAG: hypothetical protein ACT4PT_07205 [Methanobacteriota archaeon]
MALAFVVVPAAVSENAQAGPCEPETGLCPLSWFTAGYCPNGPTGLVCVTVPP